jgi:hypothetical protein
VHFGRSEAFPQLKAPHSRRPNPAGAARPALTGRAVHSVEAKAVVRIEVAAAHALAWAALWSSSCAFCALWCQGQA